VSRPRWQACRLCGRKALVTDGATLRRMRLGAGVSLRRVAAEMGVSAGYLCDMQKGDRRVTPRMRSLFIAALKQAGG
jgi:transcriptional regulator with XRE-family HTH domain